MSDCKKCLCLNACQEHYAVSEGHGIRNFDRCKCFVNKDEYVKVMHGRWIYEPVEFTYEKDIKCSVCGSYAKHASNYCPDCGTKMDGEWSETDVN